MILKFIENQHSAYYKKHGIRQHPENRDAPRQ